MSLSAPIASRALRAASAGLLAAVLLLAPGCGPAEFDDPDAFQKKITDPSGPFVQTVERGGVKIQARYAPPDAQLVRAHRRIQDIRARMREAGSGSSDGGGGALERSLQQAAKQYRNAQKRAEQSVYFYLYVEPKEGDLIYNRLQREGFQAFGQWLQKLAFRLNENVTLELDGDTEVPLSLYRMTRTYGRTSGREFLLAFPTRFDGRPIRDRAVELVVTEFGLGIGTVRFSFDLPALSDRMRLKPLSLPEAPADSSADSASRADR